MFKRIISAAVASGVASIAPQSNAKRRQQRCYPLEASIEKLTASFGEVLTGGGLKSTNQLLEFWTSSKPGSFTVFDTQADEFSC
ncbi:MAG: hypothetical protein AAGA97_10690, partial [Pseudomonadota bacterium]